MTKKISELNPYSALTGAEEWEIAADGASYKVNSAQIVTYVQTVGAPNMQQVYNSGSTINIPVGGDSININTVDATGSGLLFMSDQNTRLAFAVDTVSGGRVETEYDLIVANSLSDPAPFTDWIDQNDSILFVWNRKERAFRAGEASVDQFNTPNIGKYSFAFGLDVIAAGDNSVAIGSNVDIQASATNSVGFGDGTSSLVINNANSFNVLATGGVSFNTENSNFILGDINNSDTVVLSRSGIALDGSARYLRSLTKYADNLLPGGDDAAERKIIFGYISAIRFAPGVDRSVYYNQYMSGDIVSGADVEIEIGWVASDNSAGDVVFEISAGNTNVGDTLNAPTISQSVTDTASGVQDKIQITPPIVISGGVGSGTFSSFRFLRKGSDAADTFSGYAHVLYVRTRFLRNRLGD